MAESNIELELFKLAWCNHIARLAGMPGALNSERALQAALVQAFGPFAPEMIVHVEPSIKLSDTKRRIKPDLVVCARSEDGRYKARVVVELKFKPETESYQYPEWKDDCDKLAELALSGGVRYSVYPCGDDHRVEIEFDERTAFVFAALARADAQAFDASNLKKEAKSKQLDDALDSKHEFYVAVGSWQPSSTAGGTREADGQSKVEGSLGSLPRVGTTDRRFQIIRMSPSSA